MRTVLRWGEGGNKHLSPAEQGIHDVMVSSNLMGEASCRVSSITTLGREIIRNDHALEKLASQYIISINITEHVLVFWHRRKLEKAGVLTQEPLPFLAKWSGVDAYRTFFADTSDEIADAMMALQRSMAA